MKKKFCLPNMTIIHRRLIIVIISYRWLSWYRAIISSSVILLLLLLLLLLLVMIMMIMMMMLMMIIIINIISENFSNIIKIITTCFPVVSNVPLSHLSKTQLFVFSKREQILKRILDSLYASNSVDYR